MQDMNRVKTSLEYIEQNLKTIITAEELANMEGYSLWHYCRIFSQATGQTVAAYICKRRLDRATGEIVGGRRAIDVALDYGFDTYAGFYKAFVREYGRSPKKVRTKKGDYIMYTEKELRNILANWDIPQDLPILDVYIMDGAKASGNIWSVGEDYILKIGDRENQQKNMKVAKALAAQNFAASIPVLAKSGAEYLDGDVFAVLTRGIKGSPLAKALRFGDERQEYGYKYGESIARLHKALAAVESDICPQEFNLYARISDWSLPETKKQNGKYQMGLPDSFFDDYISNFGKLFDKLPKQLIHRDPNPSNIMFDNGEVTGFLSFDLSERNIRLWDPCYCATGILCEWQGVDGIYEKWPDILCGILIGYNSANPLTAEEREAVFYVLCSIELICVAFFETVEEYKGLAKTNREMLQYIVANKSRFTGIL